MQQNGFALEMIKQTIAYSDKRGYSGREQRENKNPTPRKGRE